MEFDLSQSQCVSLIRQSEGWMLEEQNVACLGGSTLSDQLLNTTVTSTTNKKRKRNLCTHTKAFDPEHDLGVAVPPG